VTAPIYLPPGSLVQVTSNCISRTYRLVPTDDVVAVCEACIRASAMHFAGEIQLHEFEFLSNHLHLLLTDLGGEDGAGKTPDFMGYLHNLLTTNLNSLRGISGKGWEQYSFQIIDRDDPDRILQAVSYIQNQAVAADIVKRNREWRHCSSRGLEYGEQPEIDKPVLGIWSGKARHAGRADSIRSKRAEHACRSNVPDRLSFTLFPLPGFEALGPKKLRALTRARLAKLENRAIARRRRDGTRVQGWDVARKIHWSYMPAMGRQLFGPKPTFAASTPERRAAAQERVDNFRREYAVALERFLSGDHEVVFPLGTYRMPRRFRARVATSDSS